MNKLFIIIIIFILLTYVSNIIIKRIKDDSNKKAGKKWEGIVKELSSRK
tara:strand:- start:381 stop:527 length:147 start_codon:yes stop_codon:yes gene_type:complete